MSKYNARRFICADGAFDSQAEHARWQELRLLERAGEIEDLERQPVYVLSERPKCRYTPDFRYRHATGGAPVVEDVKGVLPRDVFVRVAWLKQLHPGTRVLLLRRASPRRPVVRGWRPVNGWEIKEIAG